MSETRVKSAQHDDNPPHGRAPDRLQKIHGGRHCALAAAPKEATPCLLSGSDAPATGHPNRSQQSRAPSAFPFDSVSTTGPQDSQGNRVEPSKKSTNAESQEDIGNSTLQSPPQSVVWRRWEGCLYDNPGPAGQAEPEYRWLTIRVNVTRMAAVIQQAGGLGPSLLICLTVSAQVLGRRRRALLLRLTTQPQGLIRAGAIQQ